MEKQITAMIDSGALGLGDKLPSLRRMRRDLGLSVSTVHQAYVELERKGVIESKPRSGFFVCRRATRLPRTEPHPSAMTAHPGP